MIDQLSTSVVLNTAKCITILKENLIVHSVSVIGQCLLPVLHSTDGLDLLDTSLIQLLGTSPISMLTKMHLVCARIHF